MAQTLSEYESKLLLGQAGISIPDERLVNTPDEAAAAARALDCPVALKLCGRGIAHKTERGLVRLGLQKEADVVAAATALLAERIADDGDAGILVAPMVTGRRELIAGMLRDPQFGPCVMLGLGGIFTEALNDAVFAVAPLQPLDAEDLIAALAHSQLLGPFRGEPAVDRKELVQILETLGQIGVERPDIRSIDINPLILCDGHPVVVDALVELEDAVG